MPKFRLPLLNALPAFEAAARLQSIKKASGELHVTPGGVSRHIRNLEQQASRRLIEYRDRQVILTDAGRTLYDAVDLSLSHIHRAFAQLRGDYSDRLVISVDPDFASLWLVPRLGKLSAMLPDIFLEIRAEKTGIGLPDPPASGAIQYAQAGVAGQHMEFLFRSRLFPVCTKAMAESSPIRTPQDLSRHMLIHDRTQDEWNEYLRICAPDAEIDVRKAIVLSETALCLDAAVRGQGVAMGDDFLAANHLSDGRLIKPLEAGVLSKNAYYWIAQQDVPVHPSMEVLREWLFKSIKEVVE